MRIQSVHIPDSWDPENMEIMNEWFNNLPDVYDTKVTDEIDLYYEKLVNLRS